MRSPKNSITANFENVRPSTVELIRLIAEKVGFRSESTMLDNIVLQASTRYLDQGTVSAVIDRFDVYEEEDNPSSPAP